jgi:hypothetical protein
VPVSVSQAILLGTIGAGSLIGLGLYLGLRSGSATTAPIAAPLAGAAASAATPPAPAPMEPSQARAEAAKALEAQRARLTERCWKPSVERAPLPAKVEYVLNFTFDADGKQITRGTAEKLPGDGGPFDPRHPPAQAGRPDVTACLSGALAPVTIPPPGRSTYVEVPFGLP